MKKPLVAMIYFLSFYYVCNAFALWQGPVEVVTGKWGTSVGQFGFVNAEPTDGFPTRFLIDSNDNILISDSFNKRVQVFRPNGNVTTFSYKDLEPGWKIRQWPSEKIGVYDNIFVEGGYIERQFYDYQGNLLREISIPDCILKKVNDDGSLILQNYKTEVYYKYSSTGQLLETYKKRPLELGVVKERRSGSKRYKVTIKYPDKEWVVISKGACSRYVRDLNCNLYCPGHRQVIKYDEDGNEAARLTMPKRIAEETPARDPGVEAITKVIEEYGPPVVSPNGDVYAWKRTPDTYSIVKWTWQGPKYAPQSLKVASSKTGLHLTWEPPIYEAKYVKEYEIVRSDEICGQFTPISTVPKNTLKYEDKDVSEGTTYCYKVSAVKASGSSEYSNKAAGKIGVSKTTSMEIGGDTYLKVEKDILADKKISTAKLHSFNKTELKLLRNTIFAKYGRSFKSYMLKTWFAKKSWYKVNPNYSDKVLTNTDKKNITIFLNLEKKN